MNVFLNPPLSSLTESAATSLVVLHLLLNPFQHFLHLPQLHVGINETITSTSVTNVSEPGSNETHLFVFFIDQPFPLISRGQRQRKIHLAAISVLLKQTGSMITSTSQSNSQSASVRADHSYLRFLSCTTICVILWMHSAL